MSTSQNIATITIYIVYFFLSYQKIYCKDMIWHNMIIYRINIKKERLSKTNAATRSMPSFVVCVYRAQKDT